MRGDKYACVCMRKGKVSCTKSKGFREREKERVSLAGKRGVQAVINNLFSARTLLGK